MDEIVGFHRYKSGITGKEMVVFVDQEGDEGGKINRLGPMPGRTCHRSRLLIMYEMYTI